MGSRCEPEAPTEDVLEIRRLRAEGFRRRVGQPVRRDYENVLDRSDGLADLPSPVIRAAHFDSPPSRAIV